MKSKRHTVAPSVFTVGELADYLRVHAPTIYRLLERKELPAVKVGRDWRFTMEEIDRWRAKRQIRTPRYRN
jgi:excisionase family DNA binding protein